MPVQVIDLFCGVGGLTRGFQEAGLEVVAGFDIDETCRYAYEHNNNVRFIKEDIRRVNAEALNRYYSKGAIKALVGCAPCQPFSQMRSKLGKANALDEKYNLLLEYGRLIDEVRPTVISMENVPQLQASGVFQEFLRILQKNGYYYDMKVVYCPDYGISQSRRRFVLVGSLLGEIEIIPPTHNRNEVNVASFIKDLPPIKAGETDSRDKMHQAASLSEINLKRIKASIPGGTWKDWPEDLRCECHKKDSGKTYGSVYGRMRWNQVGPTITTQFYCYGTGRYGHPVQDRALSLREGALLQTFPNDYDFIDPNAKFSLRDIARHIGNAVPVRLGEIIGQSLIEHLKEHNVAL